jgi:hypothetical protein
MRSVRKLPDTTGRLTGLPQQGRTYTVSEFVVKEGEQSPGDEKNSGSFGSTDRDLCRIYTSDVEKKSRQARAALDHRSALYSLREPTQQRWPRCPHAPAQARLPCPVHVGQSNHTMRPIADLILEQREGLLELHGVWPQWVHDLLQAHAEEGSAVQRGAARQKGAEAYESRRQRSKQKICCRGESRVGIAGYEKYLV